MSLEQMYSTLKRKHFLAPFFNLQMAVFAFWMDNITRHTHIQILHTLCPAPSNSLAAVSPAIPAPTIIT